MFTPYKDKSINTIYNLLFCDDIDLYRSLTQHAVEDPWKTILSKEPDESTLSEIALNDGNEGRIRSLAFNALLKLGKSVVPKKLLGTIIEVGKQSGLDTLAAYVDGTARYINYSGKLLVWEVYPPVENISVIINDLMAASQNVVDRIGPWDQDRLAPPGKNQVRMTFLVSDGLYFGQGPFDVLENDTIGGPVIAKATSLLEALVKIDLDSEKKKS